MSLCNNSLFSADFYYNKKAVVSKEDTKTVPGGVEVKVDEDVERIRR